MALALTVSAQRCLLMQADDILVFDSKRLRVVGILDPGTFAYSGYHMGHVIVDCVEDESDDTA